MDVHMSKLVSFLRNGRARKKIPIGIMKKTTPPQDARPNAIKIPPPATFARDIFPLLDFIPLRNR
jgi:hypothetical protein